MQYVNLKLTCSEISSSMRAEKGGDADASLGLLRPLSRLKHALLALAFLPCMNGFGIPHAIMPALLNRPVTIRDVPSFVLPRGVPGSLCMLRSGIGKCSTFLDGSKLSIDTDTDNDNDHKDPGDATIGAQGEYISILRETVNRGCNISLMGRVYGNYKKRKLNIEHVVPRTVILSTVANASIEEQADACNDLFNMFLAVPSINRARRDYKFCSEPFCKDLKRRPAIIYGKLNSKKRKFSENARDVWWSLGNGLFVNDRLSRFVPRAQDRGLIARSILHMCDKWGCDADLVIDGGRETADKWHRENLPDQDELTHVHHVSQFVPYPHSIFLFPPSVLT